MVKPCVFQSEARLDCGIGEGNGCWLVDKMFFFHCWFSGTADAHTAKKI